jgi:pimeloyl-ACP methyl ester carboxylesterase
VDTAAEQVRARAPLRTGVALPYVEHGPPSAPETILLLHGWPDSSYSLSPLQPALASQGYRAVAFDQRGFGDAPRPPANYTIDDLAGDAAALLEALDIPQASLVGHSMGSLVARRVAQRYPTLVRRLVLIGTALIPGNQVLLEVAEGLRELPDPVTEDFARQFQAETLHGPVPEDFFDVLVAESRKAPARVWREVLEGIIAYTDAERLGEITAPTLILGGEQDALFSTGEQAAVASAIPGAQLRFYPDTGHCPNWERPDEVAAAIDAFIRTT